MRLRKASMLRLPHSSQVWLRIRCRLTIRVLSSLPAGVTPGVGHLLHLNVLQRSTRLSELERAGGPGGAGAPGRRRPPVTVNGRPRVSLSASADPDGWHWMQYQPMKKRTALSLATLGDENSGLHISGPGISF
jgi:hypothetical protein